MPHWTTLPLVTDLTSCCAGETAFLHSGHPWVDSHYWSKSVYFYSYNSIDLLFFSSLLKDSNLKQIPKHNGRKIKQYSLWMKMFTSKWEEVNPLLTQNNSNTFPMWNMMAWGFFILACTVLSNFWNVFRHCNPLSYISLLYFMLIVSQRNICPTQKGYH